MKTTTSLQSTFSKRIQLLQRAQKVTEKLLVRRAKLEEQMTWVNNQISKAVGSDELTPRSNSLSKRSTTPVGADGVHTRGIGKRGELTDAIVKNIRDAHKPLKPGQIATSLELPTKMVRNLMYTSKRFQRVGKGSFAVAKS